MQKSNKKAYKTTKAVFFFGGGFFEGLTSL
jgi:hypothetical protein